VSLFEALSHVNHPIYYMVTVIIFSAYLCSDIQVVSHIQETVSKVLPSMMSRQFVKASKI
jgi:hypothetical protein